MKPYNTQSPQQKRSRLFVLVCALLLLGCLGLLFFQSRGRRPQAPQSVTLPFAMGEQKIQVYLQLPAGWQAAKAQQRPDPLLLTLPSVLYILQNEDGDLVGAVGCQAYDPAEGENPAAIYASVRMGSVYRFAVDAATQPFCQTDTGSTLLTQVLYQDGADAPQQQNWGILSHNSEQGVFAAIELDAAQVSQEQAEFLAQALQVSA